ncbi:hypothetical protein DY000_02059242 [Brassica cretica]|uniref:Aminotransferase-like plant mobile domain-containing protein n=1 Tax=Brassica cretica TaxID=69181 RepID=A0ABQ7B1P1_BRACR|nr:hypothetical protein DY000_02059242 [Brassica cretica]
MAPPSQNIPLPSLTSTDESKLDLKALSLSVSFHGWREANSAFKSWAIKMSSLHRPTWRKAGIFEAVMASTKGLNKDTDLLLGIAERWCPDTNTFLFPWGEATITLEDVMVLLGFSVLGSPYFTPLDSSGEEILRTLEEEWVKIRKGSSAHLVAKLQWMGRFMGTRGELEHAAFLGLWLSYFVLPTRYCHVDQAVLSIAIHLSRGTRIALAPPVLAHLYADLSLLKEHIRGFKTVMLNDKVELSALFKLVQVWTWERFRELRPNNTNPLRQGEPRLALWDEAKPRKTKRHVRMRTKRNVREILANSKMESFEWRPYTKAVRNWNFPKFYPEKAMSVPIGPDLDEEFISFARCIKVSELVGKDSVECYFPNRVASQFGLLQDVPCPVNQSNLFKEAAWDEYNKPIDGLRLFVPSRSALSYFTSVYCEWWRKGKRAVELAESLGDDDTSKPFPSGSKKSLKRVSKEDETQMDRYKTQVPPRNIRRGDDDASEPVASGSKKSMKRVCTEDETQMDRYKTQVPPRNIRRGDDDTSKPVSSGSKKSLKRVSKEDETQKDHYKTHVPPRNIRRGDDDTSKPVSSGSKKSLKRVYKDDETQVPSEKDEKDDGLSIGQAMRLRRKKTAMRPSDENHSLDPPPTVLPSREVGQKLRKEFSEKLKRSRDLRTPTNVRSKIVESGGSASREVPNTELFQKEEVVKRKSEHLGDKRARNITTAEMVIDREKGVRDASESLGKRNSGRLERENNDSWIRQKIDTKDETVAQQEETGNKAGKNTVLSSANGNNSSDPPLGANGGIVDTVLSRPETRQKCDDEVGVIGINTEKKKAIVAGGSKDEKCVLHEDGQNLRSSEEEDDGKSLKHTNLAIDDISLSLEARMMKVEKTLAKIKEWKTIETNQAKNGISA